MMAITCHEARNPLNGAVGHLRLLGLQMEQLCLIDGGGSEQAVARGSGQDFVITSGL